MLAPPGKQARGRLPRIRLGFVQSRHPPRADRDACSTRTEQRCGLVQDALRETVAPGQFLAKLTASKSPAFTQAAVAYPYRCSLDRKHLS